MFTRRKYTSVSSDFEKFLKSRNCKYEKQQEDETTVFRFDYQAGHFIATIRKQDDGVEVHYPYCGEFPMEQLDLVRSKCNQFNVNNLLLKMTYSVDDERNLIDLHLSFYNNSINPYQMENQLGAVFHFQRQWVKEFDEAVDISKSNGSNDLESDMHEHQREMYLIRQQELRHQSIVPDEIIGGTDALTLGRMLDDVIPVPDMHPQYMTVDAEDIHQRIDGAEDIRAFDLRHALTTGEGKEAKFARDYTQLGLHFTQGMDQKPKILTLTITAEGEDEHALYSRVTVTAPPNNASRHASLNNKEDRYPHCMSPLIALDRSSDKQHYQEFDYMWTDTQLKLKNGERDSLDEDQQLLCRVTQVDVAYNLYWGQQMFNDGRYLEAILHLQNVFNSYRTMFYDLESDQKHTMMEVAYKLGFCYNELKLYKQAYYYLDLLTTDGKVKHTMELINTMANSKDLRIFNYLDNVMREIQENFKDKDELPDNIKQFVNFLRRRRAYALIDFGQLDQAEEMFTRMLDEEENSDYAINELAYIKHLKKKRGEIADDGNEEKENQADA